MLPESQSTREEPAGVTLRPLRHHTPRQSLASHTTRIPRRQTRPGSSTGILSPVGRTVGRRRLVVGVGTCWHHTRRQDQPDCSNPCSADQHARREESGSSIAHTEADSGFTGVDCVGKVAEMSNARFEDVFSSAQCITLARAEYDTVEGLSGG